MEYKGENEDGTYEDIIVRKQRPQERLGVREKLYKDSEKVKFRYLLVAVTVIAVTSFLTAAATLVLAIASTISRNNVSATRDSINPLSEMSEIKKNLQELKKNLSSLRESSVSKNLRELEAALADMKRELENVKNEGKNTAELWFFLNGTVHQTFFDFKKQIVKLDQKVKNVSKMPGPVGPPGYNGSQGPAGRDVSSYLSACQFKMKSSTMTPGSNKIIVHFDEPTNSKVMAVTCSTDYNAEYNLISREQASGVRRYVCTCDGKSTLFKRGTSCYLNYWICPLTT